jgi:4-oxalmesaconate hydratase
MIIDAHGHYTTTPTEVEAWRGRQIAAMATPTKPPLKLSDDEIRESLEKGQLRLQAERGTDYAIISPRASTMGHHFGGELISLYWSQTCNELIHRIINLYPNNFVGACMLPQSPGAPIDNSVRELERCVKEFNFIGCNLSPDPSGGYWTDPPLGDRYWYPLYEKMVELDVPAMIHVSAACNPAYHSTSSHYINADSTSIVQLLMSNVMQDFPTIRFIIPHGGGAIPYQWGRYRGIAMMFDKPPFEEWVKRLYFDTVVYDAEGVEHLIKRMGTDNVLFASEMIGAVQKIDPNTGRWFDDTKPYVESIDWLSAEDKEKIFEGNVQKVFPRIVPHLEARAKRLGS